jgi:hypothetical protein
MNDNQPHLSDSAMQTILVVLFFTIIAVISYFVSFN